MQPAQHWLYNIYTVRPCLSQNLKGFLVLIVELIKSKEKKNQDYRSLLEGFGNRFYGGFSNTWQHHNLSFFFHFFSLSFLVFCIFVSFLFSPRDEKEKIETDERRRLRRSRRRLRFLRQKIDRKPPQRTICALLTASPPSSLELSVRRPIESMHKRRRLSRSSRRLLPLELDRCVLSLDSIFISETTLWRIGDESFVMDYETFDSSS